eukprot:4341519-Pleurochrysis_carterae.AAC.2
MKNSVKKNRERVVPNSLRDDSAQSLRLKPFVHAFRFCRATLALSIPGDERHAREPSAYPCPRTGAAMPRRGRGRVHVAFASHSCGARVELVGLEELENGREGSVSEEGLAKGGDGGEVAEDGGGGALHVGVGGAQQRGEREVPARRHENDGVRGVDAEVGDALHRRRLHALVRVEQQLGHTSHRARVAQRVAVRLGAREGHHRQRGVRQDWRAAALEHRDERLDRDAQHVAVAAVLRKGGDDA